MKTEQEQIEAMHRNIYNSMRYTIGVTTAIDIAKSLFSAGYGDVSEYKAENERLTKILNSLTFSEKETDIFGKPALLMFAGVKVEEAIKRVAEYDGLNAEIERLKSEYGKLQVIAEILARVVRGLNRENDELTEKVKQAQIDVLNKVKILIFQKDNPYNVPFEEFISANVFCGYIDELIEEVEKQ